METVPEKFSPQTNEVQLLTPNLAINRLFTFPSWFGETFNIDFDNLKKWADDGFLFHCQGKIICHFCGYSLEKSDLKNQAKITKHQNCSPELCSKNVPLGNIEGVLNYKFESHRLYSLLKKKDWRFVTPFDLARSGFYYTGQEDNCRCFCCQLEVKAWVKEDTPESEHKKWNQKCPLLENCKIDENIRIGEEKYDMSSDGTGKANASSESFDPSEADTFNFFIYARQMPAYPNFCLFPARLESFQNSQFQNSADALAESGFFFNNGRVTCFYCNAAFENSELDPFTEHAKQNQLCPFLVMQFWQGKGPNIFSNSSINCLKCSSRRLAKVCLPCGHANYCDLCSDPTCLVCNQEILAQLYIFI